MGMQDNPLVGDYTKGISKNTVAYFEGLEQRARLEKAPLGLVAYDLQNPLFAMIRSPINPVGLDRKGRLDKAPVDKVSPKQRPKPAQLQGKSNQKRGKSGWTTVGMSELRQAIDQVRMLRQDQKRKKRT